MKLLHISDLHIGRRIGEYSLLDDQRNILNQILDITDEEKPDGILIAGDVYDKSMPPGEAVELLDDFLTELAARNLPVFMVSGNHDSPERLNFGSRIMMKNGIHIAGIFNGALHKETLEDEFGKVNIYLLPYIKPALVRSFYDGNIETYDDAVRTVTSAAEVDRQERNILVAHQFVTSGAQQPERCESESIAVGGLDNVDTSAFDAFDYVALGHLHGPQRIGRDTIRYRLRAYSKTNEQQLVKTPQNRDM
jgi:exonuclease SbcD